MDLDKYFYSNWAKSEDPAYYLYVSSKDSLSSINLQNIRYSDVWNLRDIMDSIGYHTLLYETYGTATTLLTQNFLNYPLESISFIAFHEATHQHIRNNNKIPKILEETICDVVGNYGSLDIARSSELLERKSVVNHINNIELFAEEINNSIYHIETKNKSFKFNNLQRLIDSLAIKSGNPFLNDRYNYSINNAYFVRFIDYTKYYFLIKKLVLKFSSLDEFFEFINKLPDDEAESLTKIKEKIQEH